MRRESAEGSPWTARLPFRPGKSKRIQLQGLFPEVLTFPGNLTVVSHPDLQAVVGLMREVLSKLNHA